MRIQKKNMNQLKEEVGGIKARKKKMYQDITILFFILSTLNYV